MLKIGRKESVIVIFLCLIWVIISMFQVFLFISKTPKGHTYPLLHNHPQDYYYYLSYIQQGIEGKLLVTSRFSPEKFPPQLIFTFYSIIGLMGGIFRLDAVAIYMISRIFLGALLLFLGYVIASYVYKNRTERILVLLLIILGAPFWAVDKGVLSSLGSFWTGFDPFFRVAFIPHHLFANCMLIVSFLLFEKGKRSNRIVYIIFSSVMAAFAGVTNVVNLLALFFVLFFMMFFDIRNIKTNIKNFIIFSVFPLLAVFQLNEVVSKVFPYTIYLGQEGGNHYPLDILSFMQISGITGILAFLSTPFVFRKSSNFVKISLFWFLFSFVGITIFDKYLPVTNIRYTEIAFQIPTAILSVYFLKRVIEFLKIKNSKILKHIIYPFFVGMIVFFTVPSFYFYFKEQLKAPDNLQYDNLVYAPVDFIDIAKKLAKIGYEDEVVMDKTNTSPIIPALSNKRVVYGHPWNTLNANDKVQQVNRFYSFLSAKDMEEIIKTFKLSYFLVNENTDKLPNDIIRELNVLKVYSNLSYSIYKIEK